MKALTKYLASAGAVAALTVSAASPAQAQIFGDPFGRNRGVDVNDIVTGVAVLGGIAAITRAFGRDSGQYGYDNRYRYQNDYQNAVNACGSEAQRYGQGGQVSITDIDRRGRNSYRVRGVVDAGYGNYGNYGSNVGNGRYDSRYDPRYDPRYDQYRRNDQYGRNDPYGRNVAYGRYDQRVEFACTAQANGRVTDFDVDRRF